MDLKSFKDFLPSSFITARVPSVVIKLKELPCSNNYQSIVKVMDLMVIMQDINFDPTFAIVKLGLNKNFVAIINHC